MNRFLKELGLLVAVFGAGLLERWLAGPPGDVTQANPALIAAIIMGALSTAATVASAQQQKRAQQAAMNLQERNRKKAEEQMGPGFYAGLNAMFPGMMGNAGGGITNPGVQPRAAGGPVMPGQDYLVGEQGPEVIRPMQPGMVEPNVGTEKTSDQAKAGGYWWSTPQRDQPPVAPPPGSPAPQAGSSPYGFNVDPQGTPWGNQITPGNEPGNPGGYYADWTRALFEQPGSLSPVAYERQQEQANQSFNQGQLALAGGLTGRGVDPNSSMGQMLSLANVNANQYARQQAARDYALMQENLWRQDVGAAAQMYINALTTSLNLAAARSNASQGLGQQQIQNPVDPYGNLSGGLANLGYGLQDYYNKQNGGTTRA